MVLNACWNRQPLAGITGWLGSVLLSSMLITGCATIRKADPGPLEEWVLMGNGERVVATDGTIRLSENTESKGVMLISPHPVDSNCIMRFDVQPMNESTVLVALLSLSDAGPEEELNPPDGYDGGVGWILQGIEGYFVAFCNKAHQRKPFIRKLPAKGTIEVLSEADQNYMVPEEWYQIEVGARADKVYLKINGKTVVSAPDVEFSGGYLGIRIRGTKTGQADCQIRNFAALTP